VTDDEVLAETRAFNVALEQALALLPSVHTLPPEDTRLARREGRGVFPPLVFSELATTVTIPGRGGEIPIRIIEAEQPRGAYLHIHGGGWTIGSADGQDATLEEIVRETGFSVASVDYRLAPEHPYPAGPDDCEDAARWFVERFDGRLAIGGESAGAHLAVLTLLRLRDGGVMPFDAANLVFGPYDLTGTPSRRLWGNRELLLSDPLMNWFVECFVPGTSEHERRDPAVSPLYADLRGLPPALFSCGTLDPLLDDSLFMSARWRQAGNGAALSLWPDGVHAYTAFPIEIARRSRAEQIAFLRKNSELVPE
jgi:acetyl esterase